MIYLDHAATTPVPRPVADAMYEVLTRHFGNPSSQYPAGQEMKKAVECGYWNMFRFNPALKAEGKNPFTIDSKQPVTEEYRNFLLNEARYSSLTRSFPERAEKLFGEAEVKSVERYEHLLRLKDLYAPKAD